MDRLCVRALSLGGLLHRDALVSQQEVGSRNSGNTVSLPFADKRLSSHESDLCKGFTDTADRLVP